MCTILSGSTDVWRYDIEIPAKYGVDICVGDTRGPSGIFRFLRTAPAMAQIAQDMEKICPNAVLLNYTNPIAMLCNYLQKTSPITVTGLCHSESNQADQRFKRKGAQLVLFLQTPSAARAESECRRHPGRICGIVFFVAYVIMISKMEDINRTFQFHGAEPKRVQGKC